MKQSRKGRISMNLNENKSSTETKNTTSGSNTATLTPFGKAVKEYICTSPETRKNNIQNLSEALNTFANLVNEFNSQPSITGLVAIQGIAKIFREVIGRVHIDMLVEYAMRSVQRSFPDEPWEVVK